MAAEKLELPMDIGSPSVVKKWAHVFKWTPKHMPPDKLNALRQNYDELGSTALDRLQEITAAQSADGGNGEKPAALRRLDLYNAFRGHHGKDEILQEVWNETHVVPKWVDWAQLEGRQKVFYRYAPAAIMGFAL